MGFNDPGAGPLTVPIWYDYSPGGQLWVITGKQSRKSKLLEVGTRLSLAAQAESFPYKYVSVEGAVSSIRSVTMQELSAMAIRYLGDVQGKAYADDAGIEGQIIVHVDIDRWLAVDYGK
jgi:hypothetical protein